MKIYYVMTIEAEEAGSDAKRLNRIMEDAPADIVRDTGSWKMRQQISLETVPASKSYCSRI